MPTYVFKNKETGEITEKFMKFSEREEMLKEHPELEVVIGTPAFGDSVRMGLKKPDDGFRDLLKKIKSKHRRSTINTF